LEENKAVVIHALSILDIADVTCLTSAGANYDIDDETMRNTFNNWDKRFSLTVLEVSNAYLRLRFQTVPENPKAFLKEIVKLCPTILEVTESKAEYQKIMQDLQDGHVLNLWWD
jgi:Ran GTPase-activating protein (RanGAP) involved in mRNA processing and transport